MYNFIAEYVRKQIVKGDETAVRIPEEEKERMDDWNLTAKTIMSVKDWNIFFDEAGYTGDRYWFVP